MIRRLTALALGGCAFMCASAALCSPATPVADTGDSLAWSELHFTARKFLMKAEATVRVRAMPASELAPSLRTLEPARKAIAVEGRGIEVTTESRLPFGRTEIATTWIDAVSGAVLQSEKVVSGRKNYNKVYRYGALGFFQWRVSPASKEESRLPSASWTERKQFFVDFRPPPAAGTRVSDPFALLYRIAAARLDRTGARLPVVINAKGELVELVFEAGNRVQRKFTWIDRDAGGREIQRNSSKVRKVSGTARSLADGRSSDDVDTGFLGIRGALTVLVLEGDGTPVEIRGRSKNFGEIVVKLEQRLVR